MNVDLSWSELDEVRKALTMREPLLNEFYRNQVQNCPVGNTDWAVTREHLGATISAINKIHNAMNR